MNISPFKMFRIGLKVSAQKTLAIIITININFLII